VINKKHLYYSEFGDGFDGAVTPENLDRFSEWTDSEGYPVYKAKEEMKFVLSMLKEGLDVLTGDNGLDETLNEEGMLDIIKTMESYLGVLPVYYHSFKRYYMVEKDIIEKRNSLEHLTDKFLNYKSK